MATDIERLNVQIEAQLAKFDRDMRAAVGISDKQFRAIERRSQQNAKRLEADMGKAADGINAKLKGLGKGALAGFGASLAAVGVAGAVQGFRDLATSVANVGNEARRAGLSTKAFQELKFVAEQSRIPVDALIDGMKELNLRADEFIVTGSGPAAEAFRRIGFSAKQLKANLKDPSALLVEIVARMQKLNKAAQIRVADELFGGTGGEQFVELLEMGSQGIRQMIEDANAFGLVMDEAMIKKADEVDRKFGLLATAVGTGLKRAIIEATEALDDFLDQYDRIEDMKAKTIRARVQANFQEQAALGSRISELQKKRDETPEWLGTPKIDADINSMTKQLFRLQAEYAKLQTALDKYTGLAGDGLTSVATAATDASTALRGMPAAIGNARRGEEQSMAALRRYQSGEARDVASRGMLDLIGHAEGTDRGRGYNETLDYGRWTGGDRNLTGMTLREIRALQDGMRTPENRALYGNGRGSSALGRYQITSATLDSLIGEMGLSGDEFFSREMQDRMAQQLLRRRGNSVSGLRNEWEGLRRVPDSAINTALGVTQPEMAPRDESIQAAIDQRRELGESYQEIIAQGVEFVAGQNAEAQALGLTKEKAAALRYEQELLNQAAAAGLVVTPQQAEQFRMLAHGMAEAETATARFSESQTRAIEAQDAFRDGARDVLGGFISDLREGKSASEALGNALASIADRLLDSGLDSIIDGLFGARGTAGGGILSGLPGLFGFADGGYTGAGGRTQPAGIVHKGEYVVPKRIVDQVGVRNLERMTKGYADGGLVSPVSLQAPDPRTLAGGRMRPSATRVTVGVDVDRSGNLMPFVTGIADQRAQARVGESERRAVRTLPRMQAEQQKRMG